MTARAFCVPLATYSVLPLASNARALGEAPNRSEGLCLTPNRLHYLKAARIDDTQVIARGIGDHQMALVGSKRQRRGMHSHNDFGLHLAFCQIDRSHGPLIGDELYGINLYLHASSGRPGQVSRLGTSSAPIGHV